MICSIKLASLVGFNDEKRNVSATKVAHCVSGLPLDLA